MKLFKRHHHVWVLVAKMYAEPMDMDRLKRWAGEPERFEHLAMGVTTMLFHCHCGNHRRVSMLGKQCDADEGQVVAASEMEPQVTKETD